MMLKSQKRSQPKPYVIALRSTLSRRASFYSTKLLDASMIGLYCPCHTIKLHSLKLRHFHFVRRPVFNVAVFGHKLEYLYHSIPLQMQKGARLGGLNFANSSIPASIWIDLAITFQLCQPEPSQIANGFEVIDTPVPAIEEHTSWLETSFLSCKKHLAKMIILRRAIRRLIKEAIITRYVAVAIGPQKRDEIDATNHLAMFARPMAAYEFDLFSVLLIKSRIVQHQDAASEINLMTRFLPEVIAVGINAQQQTVDGIVSRGVILIWLYACCFCAAIDSRGSN